MVRQSIRFREYINGSPVVIKLAIGEIQTHKTFARTDEGYMSSQMSWEFDGEIVWCYSQSRCRDCDGVLDRDTTSYFDPSEAKHYDVEGVKYPVWTLTDRDQRDHYAEAMGY